MKSIRLNQANRRSLNEILTQKVREKKNKEQESYGEGFGQEIYDEIYGKHAELLATLPKSWLHFESYMYVNNVKSDGGGSSFLFDNNSKIPIPPRGSNFVKIEMLSKPLAKKLTSSWQKKEKTIKEYDVLISSTYQILNSCTSTKQLLEKWPESAKAIEEVFSTPTTALSVVYDFSKLNKSLGI